MERVFLIMGSNRGEREALLEKAAGMIRKKAGKIQSSSSIYETEPWGFTDPVPFLNQVLEIRTDLQPPDLLTTLQRIEDELGRSRTVHGYAPRTMDIDILIFGEQIINFPGLKIPHPRLPQRRFTLTPLAEIAGDLIHPELRVTIRELLEKCKDKRKVERFK